MLVLVRPQVSTPTPVYYELTFSLTHNPPSIGKNGSATAFVNTDWIVVEVTHLTTEWSGNTRVVKIPAGKPIVVLQSSSTKIAETAQPLLVTGPVYPFNGEPTE